jgi:probable HAF family extracellular repeat protein
MPSTTRASSWARVWSDGFDGTTHAFVWRDGVIFDIGVGLGVSNEAHGMNEHGDVVGSVTLDHDTQHAFLWRRNGERVDLGTLGGPYGIALGINKHGQVVGVSSTAENHNHAFLWQDGTMTDLGTLAGGSVSGANSINDRGQIVGVSDIAGGFFRAVLWKDGSISDLGTLGGASSQAFSINEAGEISGTASISLTSGETHAALRKDGRWIDIGAQLGPGITSIAYQVNEKGQLVGTAFGFRDGFQFHPILWSPERCR